MSIKVLWFIQLIAAYPLGSSTSSMLSTPEASKAVFEGANGTLAGVSKGKYIIDCATLAESDMKRMYKQVEEKGG